MGVTNANARSTSIDAYLTHIADVLHDSGEVQDAITAGIPLLRELNAKGKKQMWNGGRTMNVPLMYGLNPNFGSVGPYDTIPLDGVDGITEAMYKPSNYAEGVSIDGPQLRACKGKGEILNIAKTKTEQAMNTFMDRLSADLFDIANYTVPSTTGNGGKNIVPIPALIAKANTYDVGGIDTSAYAWWMNQAIDSDGTTFITFLDDVDEVYFLCSKGPGGAPDLVVGDIEAYRAYMRSLRSLQRIPEWDTGVAGFDTIKVHQARFIWDEHMCDYDTGTNYTTALTTASMVFINSKFFKFYVRPEANFTPTGWEWQRPRQDVMACAYLFEGSPIVSNRRKLGLLEGIAFGSITS